MNDQDLEIYSDHVMRMPERDGFDKIKKGKTLIQFGTKFISDGYDQLRFGCGNKQCANDELSAGGQK